MSSQQQRPRSREGTYFPAGVNISHSTATSERLGAFGSLQLDAKTPNTWSRTPTPEFMPVNGERRPSTHILRPESVPVPYRHDHPHNSTVSNADTSETKRKYEKLSEVYSTSGDTVEFARNLSAYLNDRIPYGVTVAILVALILIAFTFSLVGILNIPFCPIQPMIPIWLMVAGFLFTISAIFRIYHHIPTPAPRNRRDKNLTLALCGIGLEIIFVVANVVWLILGCVWVYGVRSKVHFYDHMFEAHYCDSGVYWAAFAAVTGYLVFACLIIFLFICLLAVGSCKEGEANEDLP